MVNCNPNVCKAFKDKKERCIGCTGVCDGSLTIQHFGSTDDCNKYAQQHCEQGGTGCPLSAVLSSLQCRGAEEK